MDFFHQSTKWIWWNQSTAWPWSAPTFQHLSLLLSSHNGCSKYSSLCVFTQCGVFNVFYHWQSVFPPTSAKCHPLVMTVSEDVSLRSKDVDVDFRMSKSHYTKESWNFQHFSQTYRGWRRRFMVTKICGPYRLTVAEYVFSSFGRCVDDFKPCTATSRAKKMCGFNKTKRRKHISLVQKRSWQDCHWMPCQGEMPLVDQDDNCPHWASQGLCEPWQFNLTNWHFDGPNFKDCLQKRSLIWLNAFQNDYLKPWSIYIYLIYIFLEVTGQFSPTQGPWATENGELRDELRHTEGSCGWRGASQTSWEDVSPKPFPHLMTCTGARTTRASAGLNANWIRTAKQNIEKTQWPTLSNVWGIFCSGSSNWEVLSGFPCGCAAVACPSTMVELMWFVLTCVFQLFWPLAMCYPFGFFDFLPFARTTQQRTTHGKTWPICDLCFGLCKQNRLQYQHGH